MIKPEKTFEKPLGVVQEGFPCIILMTNGDVVQTSRVVKWHNNIQGDWMIETMNTIYRAYNLRTVHNVNIAVKNNSVNY